jgi:hypothetical protein
MSSAARHNEKKPAPAGSRGSGWTLVALVVLFALLVYRDALMPGSILHTSDDNIGAMATRKALLPEGFLRAWYPPGMAGQPTLLNLSWTNLVLWLLPVQIFQNLIHALDLIIASLALGWFLRERGTHRAAAAVAALTAFWLGSTFFLTYAGHIGKFGVVMFAALALWCIECAARRRSLAWAILGGGALGGMFLEQADVGLFFALVLGPYAVFAVGRESGFALREHLRVVLPVAVLALVIGFRAIWMARAFFSMDASVEAPPEDRQQVWSYCTQWSWPPEETLEWIAPGYFGWRSGEPDGPYWGRLGRSDGWEQTRQGYPNFKLENLYLGAFPMALALLAIYLSFVARKLAKPDVMFWSVAALLTFVLGLGKFTPLYRLFFELPGMSSIRAPVKFMQVTQFALAILAAMGLDGLLRGTLASMREGTPRTGLTGFQRGLWLAGGVVLLAALGQAVTSSAQVQKIAAAGWGQAAVIIADNRVGALVHGGLLLLGVGGWLGLMRRARSVDTVHRLAWLVVAVVALDQLWISHRYVQTVKAEGFIAGNPVTDYLKKELGQQRVFLASQGSFYNQWLSVLFPYHDLTPYNVTQIRMTKDYEQFLGAVGQDVRRLWPFFAVGQIMGPAGLWPELQKNEATRADYELGYAYNVVPRGAGVDVISATPARPGQHVIVRHRGVADRYALVGSWEALEGPAALQRLRDPAFTPLQQVVVTEAAAAGLPASALPGRAGTVRVEASEAGYAKLTVSAERPGILRASESFTPFWRARLNGKETSTFRCDYIFTGLAIPAGLHTVELEHRPPLATFWLQSVGLLFCGVAIVAVIRRRPQSS